MIQFSSKTKLIYILLSIFVIGCALGFIGGQAFQKHMYRNARKGRTDMRTQILTDMTTEIGLSMEQQKKVEVIFDNGQLQIQDNMKISRQKNRAIRESLDQEIMKILTPPQQIKFQQFKAKRFRRPGMEGNRSSGVGNPMDRDIDKNMNKNKELKKDGLPSQSTTFHKKEK